MNVRLVTSLREFDSLAPIWCEVTGAGEQTTPFLSHDWFACCWRTAGPDRRREVWVLEDVAGPVALVPLVHYRSHECGLPIRVLGFLDCPDAPFVGIPMAASADTVARAFATELRKRTDWDVLDLRRLPHDSPTLKAIQTMLRGNFAFRDTGGEGLPCVDIEGDWDEFVRYQPASFRSTWEMLEERLAERGAVAIEEHRDIDPEGPAFGEVLEVSRQSWRASSTSSTATVVGMPRFFRELTRRACSHGWLSIWILRIDGRAAATEYQIGHDGQLHVLRADVDGRLAGLSASLVLSIRIMRALFERRVTREYVRGPRAGADCPPLVTGVRQTVSLRAYAPTAYGRLLERLDSRLLPFFRRWRHENSA